MDKGEAQHSTMQQRGPWCHLTAQHGQELTLGKFVSAKIVKCRNLHIVSQCRVAGG